MMYLQIQNYTKEINGQTVLSDVNLSMEKGKIYGIKGKNGSGKTMLMRAVCGLIRSTKGRVVIDGQEIGKDISFPPSVGALIENPGFIMGYTGYENLMALAKIKNIIGEEEVIQVMERVGLSVEKDKKFRKYSLGMKQKLGIAAAVMEKPDLIILDEPTNALDETSIELLRGILQEQKERGALILLSCHDTEELKLLSDEVIQMNNGRVVEYEQ